MAGKKVPLPVKITAKLMEKVDRACEALARRAGVPVTRTAFVEKAIDQLCGQVEDEEYRERMKAERAAAGPRPRRG